MNSLQRRELESIKKVKANGGKVWALDVYEESIKEDKNEKPKI